MSTMPWQRLTARLAIVIVLAAVSATVTRPAVAAADRPIHPGVAVTIAGTACEAGVALHRGPVVYLAIPASCAGSAPGTPQNGCAEAEAPVGSPAVVAGARHRGILVYNSFSAMQARGTTNAAECAGNDLALIRLNHADRHLVTGTIPGTSAPTAVAVHAPASGTAVTLGSTSGTAEGSTDSGWSSQVMTMSAPTAGQLGEPLVSGTRVVGLLDILPAILALRPYSQVASLHPALVVLRATKRFRHVALIKAGQHG